MREQIDAPYISVTQGQVSIEFRSIGERHHLVQLAAWLMANLESRLGRAWHRKAVRYNHMQKDFDEPPRFYAKIVAGFSDWPHS